MSIYDNIAFGVRLFEKLSRVEMDERAVGVNKGCIMDETKDSYTKVVIACRVGSNSVSVLLVVLLFVQKFYCWMSPVLLLTQFQPVELKN